MARVGSTTLTEGREDQDIMCGLHVNMEGWVSCCYDVQGRAAPRKVRPSQDPIPAHLCAEPVENVSELAMMALLKSLGCFQKGSDSLVGRHVQCGEFNLLCEEVIGTGGFASIYRVRDHASNKVYALKHLRLPHDVDTVSDVRHEMRVMHLLGNHPNVLKLHAASFDGPAGQEADAFLLMDYCPETLQGIVQRKHHHLDDLFVHEVFSEVCHAVAQMHALSPPCAHRDIKIDNILKTTDGKWVLCDFGSATSKGQVFETPAEIAMEEDVIRRTTTPAYRAPEMWDLVSRQRIDTKVDIWALGVLLYVLMFDKLPFQGDAKLCVLFGRYEMPPGKHPLMCDLIRGMLTTDPALRPDVMTVISRLDVIKQFLLQSIPGAPPAVAPQPAQPPASAAAVQTHALTAATVVLLLTLSLTSTLARDKVRWPDVHMRTWQYAAQGCGLGWCGYKGVNPRA